MIVNGFHLVRKSDSFELARWTAIPSRVEVFDGNTVIRVDSAGSGWDIGPYTITATSWTVADPLPPVVATWASFVSKFTDTEWAALQKVLNTQITGGNGSLARFLALAAINGVDMSNAQTMTYKAQTVTAAILTQPRADVIFTAP